MGSCDPRKDEVPFRRNSKNKGMQLRNVRVGRGGIWIVNSAPMDHTTGKGTDWEIGRVGGWG